MQGTREILARGHLTVRGGPVQLKVGEPIPTRGLTTKDRRHLTAQVRERISELLGVQAAAAAK